MFARDGLLFSVEKKVNMYFADAQKKVNYIQIKKIPIFEQKKCSQKPILLKSTKKEQPLR